MHLQQLSWGKTFCKHLKKNNIVNIARRHMVRGWSMQNIEPIPIKPYLQPDFIHMSKNRRFVSDFHFLSVQFGLRVAFAQFSIIYYYVENFMLKNMSDLKSRSKSIDWCAVLFSIISYQQNQQHLQYSRCVLGAKSHIKRMYWVFYLQKETLWIFCY